MILRWWVLGMPAIALWGLGAASSAADGTLDFGWQAVDTPVAAAPARPGSSLPSSQEQPSPLGKESEAATPPTGVVVSVAVSEGRERPQGTPTVEPNLAFSPPVILPPVSPEPSSDFSPVVAASPVPVEDGVTASGGELLGESRPARPLAVPATPLPAAEASEAPAISPPPAPTVPAPLPVALKALFAGGADSVVTQVVGSAEGTRTLTGQYTAAYFGHRDPGNGAWNLGSFSYQHGAASPEQADRHQLQQLQAQARILAQQARDQGLTLTELAWLNGIDLANQAPAAALDRGYIPWLAQARRLHMPEAEAILWARTRAFLDPDTGRWNAPGLGNTVQSISADQARRQRAIAATLDHLTAKGWPQPTMPPPF